MTSYGRTKVRQFGPIAAAENPQDFGARLPFTASHVVGQVNQQDTTMK